MNIRVNLTPYKCYYRNMFPQIVSNRNIFLYYFLHDIYVIF